MAVSQYNTTVWDISAPFEYWYPKKQKRKNKYKKTKNKTIFTKDKLL